VIAKRAIKAFKETEFMEQLYFVPIPSSGTKLVPEKREYTTGGRC
jgi:hypothetical protein